MGKAGKEREGPGKSSINCSEGEGHRFESCRVRQLPISRSIFWPVPDCPLEVTSGRKAASRLCDTISVTWRSLGPDDDFDLVGTYLKQSGNLSLQLFKALPPIHCDTRWGLIAVSQIAFALCFLTH